MGNPGNILMDLDKELKGLLLEDTFEVLGHKYTLRLLSESETIWTFEFLNPSSTLSIAVASRLANLAIGLRAIDGYPVDEVFKDTFDFYSEDKKDSLLKAYEESQKVYATLVMDWLKQKPSEFVTELHECWQELQTRRYEAQEEVKNSLGEDSVKEESKSLTESSQPGEQ